MGTDVHMNGLPLRHHKVELNEDGTVRNIGKLWRLRCWAEDGAIEFRSTTFVNDMESRAEIWRRTDPKASPMRLLQYGGGELPESYRDSKDAEDIALLTALVAQWR